MSKTDRLDNKNKHTLT